MTLTPEQIIETALAKFDHDVIETALAKLDHGNRWGKGQMKNPATGHLCIYGALTEAFLLKKHIPARLPWVPQGEAWRGLQDFVLDSDVVAFNDDPDTSWEDVELVFKKALNKQ